MKAAEVADCLAEYCMDEFFAWKTEREPVQPIDTDGVDQALVDVILDGEPFEIEVRRKGDGV